MNRYVILAVLVLANVATALLVVRDRHEHRLGFCMGPIVARPGGP